MKNKILILIIMTLFLFTSTISTQAIAPTPRVELNDYEITSNNINNIYVSGTCSICKGQMIGIYDPSGKIIYAYTVLGNSNSKESFKIQVPERFLNEGTNTFKVKSLPVKNVINGSNPKTLTITIGTSKKDQIITANNLSLMVNEKKNLNAKVSSNLPLSYDVDNPKIATIDSSGTVIGRSVGSTKVIISQPGNNEYNSVKKIITITVQTAVPVTKSYTITYNANGGSGTMTNQTVKEGQTFKLKDNKFTKNGYVFKGWSTTKNGNVVYKNQQSITITKNLTLYAVWKNLKVFSGKNVLVLGDSIQAGFGKYAVTAAKRLGAKKVTNKSVGGRTVSYIKGKASKTNSILYQLKHDSWYKKNVKNYKYVIIAAGTNDYSWGVISANKLQKDTVSTINYLRKYNKDSIIIIVTPLHRWAGKSYIKGVEKYRQKMATAAKGYKNIYVIDGKTIVKKNESKYFVDYVHPKTTFAKKTLAPRLITQIQNKLI